MIIIKVLRTNLIGITARTAQALTFESSPRYLVEKSKDFSTFFVLGEMGVMGTLRLSEGRGCLQTMPNGSNEKTAKQD